MENERKDEIRDYAFKLSEVFDGADDNLITQVVAFFMASYIYITCEKKIGVNLLAWSALFVGQFFYNVRHFSNSIKHGKSKENV